jgi:hypothetical protein
MLCNRATFDARAITPEDTIDLGWYDITTGDWHFIDSTDSFNWQQGAMLQWMPNDGNKVIYNISRDNHFKSLFVIFEMVAKGLLIFRRIVLRQMENTPFHSTTRGVTGAELTIINQ